MARFRCLSGQTPGGVPVHTAGVRRSMTNARPRARLSAIITRSATPAGCGSVGGETPTLGASSMPIGRRSFSRRGEFWAFGFWQRGDSALCTHRHGAGCAELVLRTGAAATAQNSQLMLGQAAAHQASNGPPLPPAGAQRGMLRRASRCLWWLVGCIHPAGCRAARAPLSNAAYPGGRLLPR